MKMGLLVWHKGELLFIVLDIIVYICIYTYMYFNVSQYANTLSL